MFYLRKTTKPDTYDICSTRGRIVAPGQTELEVRRFFRDRAIVQARDAVNEMLREVKSCRRR